MTEVGDDRLECVVNVSEGRNQALLDRLAAACGVDLLDVHTDPHHNRSVFTLVGTLAPRALATLAVESIDLGHHDGVHPRLGAVDVVPFVALDGDRSHATAARDGFARWAGETLGLPCFLYGDGRSLPDVRRGAFRSFPPDTGPPQPHPTAGACAVGARDVLVAYNLWLPGADLEAARTIAGEIRRPGVRALGLQVGPRTQVSTNLVNPNDVGPAEVYDDVAARAVQAGTRVEGAELVGLIPRRVLEATPEDRWEQLDLSADRTIEWRLERRRT